MSIVSDTIGDIQINRIPGRIAVYEEMIENAEAVFQLSGVNLEEACKEHAQNLMAYDVTLQECKTIEDVIRFATEEIESKAFERYLNGMQIKHSVTEIKQLVKGDPQLLAATKILLEVQHTKRRLESIVEALRSMGWSLNNIVKLRIAQLDHINLD